MERLRYHRGQAVKGIVDVACTVAEGIYFCGYIAGLGKLILK